MRDRELAEAALANADADRELLRSRAEETFNRYALAQQGQSSAENAIVASEVEKIDLQREASMLRDLLRQQEDAIMSKNRTLEEMSGVIEMTRRNAADALEFERQTQRDKQMLQDIAMEHASRRGPNRLLAVTRRSEGATSEVPLSMVQRDRSVATLMEPDEYEFMRRKRAR
jgi:hypothetical protein